MVAFIATWEYGPDSQLTTSCNEGGGETRLELSGTFEIVAGARSDLLTGMTNDCPIALTLFDRTAIALQGQRCDVGPPNARVTIEGATFALGESDATLTFRTFTETTTDGVGACTTSTMGSAVKRP